MEYTTNRVGEQYFHQLDRSGHTSRISDLTRFAELGIQRLRYPVLWERIAPAGMAKANWQWSDERLARLRELDLPPIVGLVHHGSGPRHTDLLDPAFATGLAEFARAVAQRYPWIDSFTPVNEPLTTARFSALYGHWYPHKKDPFSWARALINQCRAVILSMEAIRQEIPHARLVQTEDMGKTFSTPMLQYQADFENERRWLSFDLIGGYITPHHAMWTYLIYLGIKEAELAWFQEHGCAPEVLGINYYLTSERFLDERLEHYPSHTHGGNQRQPYADIEAVRVRAEGLCGAAQLLQEVWQRYGQPVALTEVHNGCTREEQLRWLLETWQAAGRLREQGVAVEAITVWSLLGTYDWDSLVTRQTGHYEPGVFDLRAPNPRPTALATLVKQLTTHPEQSLLHPVLEESGWWHRSDRFCYGFKVRADGERLSALAPLSAATPPTRPVPHAAMSRLTSTGTPSRHQTSRPLLIIDSESSGSGAFGQALAHACYMRGLPYQLVTRQAFELTQIETFEKMLNDCQPWAVIHQLDQLRDEWLTGESLRHDTAWDCLQGNWVTKPDSRSVYLAQTCARRGLKLLTFSSDRVFDGSKVTPYLESDPTALPGHYGYSQAEAEKHILQIYDQALTIRAGPVFSAWQTHNFVSNTVKRLSAHHPVRVSATERMSPTYLPELVSVSLDLLIDQECGYWHLANKGAVSWIEWASQIAECAGLNSAEVRDLIKPVAQPDSDRAGKTRPVLICRALDSERGQLMSPLAEVLEQYLQESGLRERL